MRRRAAPPPCRRGSREAVPVAVAVAAVALEAIWVEEGTVQQAVTEVMAVAAVALEAMRVEAEAAEAIAAAAAMAAAMAAAKAEEAKAEEAMATAEEVKAKVEEATVVAKAEEAKAEARAAAVGMVGDAAAPVATLVATEAMVAERTGLVVEEGTVQAMTVGTAAWLSSFFFKRACNSAKGTRAVVQHARPATKSRQNFATVSEFRRGMVIELL